MLGSSWKWIQLWTKKTEKFKNNDLINIGFEFIYLNIRSIIIGSSHTHTTSFNKYSIVLFFVLYNIIKLLNNDLSINLHAILKNNKLKIK